VTRHIAAFALCAAVGSLVCLAYIVAREVLDFPHAILDDSSGSETVPWTIGTALVFATVCTIIRAVVRRAHKL
jgi:hypothetical protein